MMISLILGSKSVCAIFLVHAKWSSNINISTSKTHGKEATEQDNTTHAGERCQVLAPRSHVTLSSVKWMQTKNQPPKRDGTSRQTKKQRKTSNW